MDVSGSRMFLFPPGPTETISGPPYNLDLLSLANVGYLISQKPLDDVRLQLLPQVYTAEKYQKWLKLDLPGKVHGILTSDYLGERLFVYENPLVLQRFFMVGDVKVQFCCNKCQGKVSEARPGSGSRRAKREARLARATVLPMPVCPTRMISEFPESASENEIVGAL